jgi:two-component system, chemotaxis family, protein-glutamate methylesterase/glutaminase
MKDSLPIRVLVVDDSAVMRGLLRMVLATSPEIELAGMAQDGPVALEAIERLNPDLVLLDIEMPRMNGLEVLAEIRARGLHVKVIMCSTLTRRGAGITLEALARGAMDYVAKPTAQQGAREGVSTLSRELLPKIFALFPAQFLAHGRQSPTPMPSRPEGRAAVEPVSAAFSPSLVVVGVSTGGPAALERFLPALPADFPLPVFIVQHMPQLFTGLLAERLDDLCSLSVREAEGGAQPQPGVVYLARGDWHMEIAGAAPHCSLRLSQGPPEHSCRPSVDVLFRSAAARYGNGVLAVVLTGMGSDGLDGCRAVRAAGGKILVQDRQTSAVWGMPGVVAEAGLADQMLPLDAMAGAITRFTARHSRREPT